MKFSTIFSALSHTVSRPRISAARPTAVLFLQCSRLSQTASSAVGPNAFYSMTKLVSPNADVAISVPIKKTETPSTTSREVLEKARIHVDMSSCASCEVHQQLHKLAPRMNEVVFFYHEMTPHLGMMLNIKEYIYNHYRMVGPIRSAWYQILTQHHSLADLLLRSVHSHECDSGTNGEESLGSLAQLLDSLEKKKDISSCKYEKSVRESDNMIQFRYKELETRELIALQVLAQYGHYHYEIV